MHYRRAYRDAAVAALGAAPELIGFTHLSAWAQNIDEATLPAFGVATPRETKAREAHDTSVRATVLTVALKRAGGDDLEDLLDADSVVVERAVIGSIETNDRECALTDTSVEIDGGASRRIGTIIMNFTVTFWPVEPLTGV